MSALVCGSIAFDSIMIFPDQFKNHILPDQLHSINVSFLVPKMHQSYGGCAANIAYGVHYLENEVCLMGTVGQDFEHYRRWLNQHGISQEYIKEIDDQYTAHAYIMTDQDDNQITAFHPGAMNYCHLSEIVPNGNFQLGLIAPEGREGMLQHAKQMVAGGIPYIFDPGQGVPMFNKNELDFFLENAEWLACNDYEAKMIMHKMDAPLKEISGRVKAMVITRGKEGSIIYKNGEEIVIPPVVVDDVVDPTGCGDAYRAGLIHGLLRDMDWETTGRVASLMGSIKVQHRGTQTYHVNPQIVSEQFIAAFGYAIDD